MNCKVCGTRLGILERWRYGDFCSQDHREIFALDLAELDKKLVVDVSESAAKNEASASSKASGRKTEGKGTRKAAESEELTVSEQASAEVEGVEEAEPPMAGFVPQGDATPCDPLKRKEQERRPVAEKTEKPSEVWRAMARKAVKDELPPANSPALKGRELPSIVVEAPQQSVASNGGFCLERSYPAMSPPAGMPMRAQGMPQPGLTMPAPGFWGPGLAVSAPIVPAQPSHWIDEEGWHWISDAAAMSAPTVESVLSMYPMAAPWASWPVMPPGVGGRPMQAPAQVPSGPMAPGGMGAPMGMNPAAGAPGAYGAPRQPGQVAFPAPQNAAQPLGGAAWQGAPAEASQGPAMPRAGLGVGMSSGLGPTGFGSSGFGAGSFGPPSLGAMGPGVAGGLFGGGQVVGMGMPQPPSHGPMPQGGGGYHWRELPPPFFSALVDLSSGVRPMDESRRCATPSSRHADWPEAAPEVAPLRVLLPCQIVFAPQAQLECDALNAPLPPAVEQVLPPHWPDAPAAIPLCPGLPRPRVPRRVAPAVVLPLGSRLGLPKPAEPLMLTGSGLHGGRTV